MLQNTRNVVFPRYFVVCVHATLIRNFFSPSSILGSKKHGPPYQDLGNSRVVKEGSLLCKVIQIDSKVSVMLLIYNISLYFRYFFFNNISSQHVYCGVSTRGSVVFLTNI